MGGFFKVTDEKQRHLAAIAELNSGSTFISELILKEFFALGSLLFEREKTC